MSGNTSEFYGSDGVVESLVIVARGAGRALASAKTKSSCALWLTSSFDICSLACSILSAVEGSAAKISFN